MATSDLERTPFDFAREMRSVCVRAVGKNNGRITLLVMDQCNCNEVIAFITCDSSTGKLQCSDRESRAIFTADCGVNFRHENEIIFWINQGEEKLFPSWKVKRIDENTCTCISQKSPFNKDDPNRQFKTTCYSRRIIPYWVYTVTNELNEEVCIIRCESMATNITYFQSMDTEAKLLLLAFSVKGLHADFCLQDTTFPNIVVSREPPRTIGLDEKGSTVAEGIEVQRSSINLTAVVNVMFHKAGYNKALGMQYHDVFDQNTGITLLTFEVSVEDKHNITAILKDGNGTTILTASKLWREPTIQMKSGETFTFKYQKLFSAFHPGFYDSDGKIFLEVRQNSRRKGGDHFQRRYSSYKFYNFNQAEGKETSQALVSDRGPNELYVTFMDQNLDAISKAIILAYALRSTFRNFNSHTTTIPAIDYCYNSRN